MTNLDLVWAGTMALCFGSIFYAIADVSEGFFNGLSHNLNPIAHYLLKGVGAMVEGIAFMLSYIAACLGLGSFIYLILNILNL